jgi:LEA14-like dessication related protein
MRVTRTLAVGIVALSTALGACSHAFRQPEVTVTGARLGGVGLRGGLVYFDVAVRNPNRYTLRANQFTYDLRVQDPTNASNWLPFAVGSFDQDVKIGSGETTPVEIPISFDYATGQAAVRSIMDRGIFNYQVVGQVHVTEPIAHTVPYRHQGAVTMSGAH